MLGTAPTIAAPATPPRGQRAAFRARGPLRATARLGLGRARAAAARGDQARAVRRCRAQPGPHRLGRRRHPVAAVLPGHLRGRPAEPGHPDPLRGPERAADRAGRTRLRAVDRPRGADARARHPDLLARAPPAAVGLRRVRRDASRTSSGTPTCSTCSTSAACRSAAPTAPPRTRSSSSVGTRPSTPNRWRRSSTPWSMGDGEEVTLEIDAVVRRWKLDVAEAPTDRRRATATSCCGALAGGRGGVRPRVLRGRGTPTTAGSCAPSRSNPASRRSCPKRTVQDLEQWQYPRKQIVPADRDRPRALQRRDLPRLHPRLPVLPGRDDHPPGPRAAARDRPEDGRGGRARTPASRRSGLLSLSSRRPLRHRARSPATSPTSTRAPPPRCRCRRPASTRSTSPCPTSWPATAAGRG